jgi:hypothetical protein
MFVLNDLRGQVATNLWTTFSHLFSSPVAILQDPWVQFLISLAMAIALGCLPVLITYQASRRVLESADGQELLPPGVLVRRSVVAGLAVTGIAMYGWFAGTLADYLRDVLGATPLQTSFLELFFLSRDPTAGLAGLLLILTFLIGAALVVIQRIILSAEFTVLMIIGPFLALQKVAEDRPAGWQLWKREVVAVCIAPVLQLLILFLFMLRLGAGGAAGGFTRWFEAFGLLYLLWHMPRWARQFTYSAGVGSAAAGLATGAGRLAVMQVMLRSAIKK